MAAMLPGIGSAAPPRFQVRPGSLEFATEAGQCFPNCGYGNVTIHNRSNDPIVIQLPVGDFSDSHFWDTQADTCWQRYEVSGIRSRRRAVAP
jgi:hypothetical protein